MTILAGTDSWIASWRCVVREYQTFKTGNWIIVENSATRVGAATDPQPEHHLNDNSRLNLLRM